MKLLKVVVVMGAFVHFAMVVSIEGAQKANCQMFQAVLKGICTR